MRRAFNHSRGSPIRVHFDRDCAEARGDHYQRVCPCGHRWVERLGKTIRPQACPARSCRIASPFTRTALHRL